jgi:hypothetical protein
VANTLSRALLSPAFFLIVQIFHLRGFRPAVFSSPSPATMRGLTTIRGATIIST